MKINCVICNSEFTRFGKQAETAKTCSRKCLGILFKAKPNTDCTNCGEKFHMKESEKTKYKRNLGFFCSIKCVSENKKTSYKGVNNHQYGLKGELNKSFKGLVLDRKNHKNFDLYIYVGHKYPGCNKNGRVLYHRYLVNENYFLFEIDFFDKIDGYHILKNKYDVHHINNNHNDNSISNLEVLTRSDHTSLHNKQKTIIRDNKGRISGVFKSGELLENLVADNQQPS